MNILDRVYNARDISDLKRFYKDTEKVAGYDFSFFTDEELRRKTVELKGIIGDDESKLDEVKFEAFALVKEAVYRIMGFKLHDEQLIAGFVLHEGRIAEALTGSGKTVSAVAPLYLNALTGKGAHLVTVNDYLASRDARDMGRIFNLLGLSVGCILHDQSPLERRRAYACDITYGTNNEFGFDYLKDNMVVHIADRVQRGLNYVIVDEVDSILIDEARTPLIISGSGEDSSKLYNDVDVFCKSLSEEDYEKDEKEKGINLSGSGISKAEKYFNVGVITDIKNVVLYHHINQALRANYLMKLDKDYIVKNGEIIIVDEFTGRLMHGRRYSDGLHQAIEAKEGLVVQKESKTYASITFQNYFRLYNKLSGMTGTAKTEEEEFIEIYHTDVFCIPPHNPVIRVDHTDVVYPSLSAKLKAIASQVEECFDKGQPVLIGTSSIDKSEMISGLLMERGIIHRVLNAKFHEKEAEIIAQAGRYKAVTIATNMAGRGTDIMLGGNVDYLLITELKKKGYSLDKIGLVKSIRHEEDVDPEDIKLYREYNKLKEAYEEEILEERERVKAAGGLYVIGTERHDSRRIDNQLRGRSGRQGDPGESKFFLCLDDDLLRLFGSESFKRRFSVVADSEGAISHRMVSKSVESAQKKIEGRNFGIRKSVLEYDDVVNKQRKVIYEIRDHILEGDDMSRCVESMVKYLFDYYMEVGYDGEGDRGLYEHIKKSCEVEKVLPSEIFDLDVENSREMSNFRDLVIDNFHNYLAKKDDDLGDFRLKEVERVAILTALDRHWVNQIDAMDKLKKGIGLRAIGQIDPVLAYQSEGYRMLHDMNILIIKDSLSMITEAGLEIPKREELVDIKGLKSESDGSIEEAKKQGLEVTVKVGRNKPCPCGSGKKYKNCCGRTK